MSSELEYFGPEFEEWRALDPDVSNLADEEKERKQSAAKAAKDDLRALLLASLQMQHLSVLAGSGTSLGPVVKGPSMWVLWDYCVNTNPGTGDDERQMSSEASKVIADAGFDIQIEGENIEALLSKCDALLQIRENQEALDFVTKSKNTILGKCTEFIDHSDDQQLSAHRTFLHRMSRRRVRDSRLKLFTTNYDVCFEVAAGRQGLVVLDGFSYSIPRHFDPRFFLYDIVRRPASGNEAGTPLEGVFHLYKLHGSVNWDRRIDGLVEVDASPDPDSAALIYPANGKYQQSYIQPHLELISQYLAALREPNTCLVVAGFGFNDDHLSEPILAAVRTNPHLRLVVVNPEAKKLIAEGAGVWKLISELALQGDDVWMINATFSEFASMIPDLKSLTPAQKLSNEIKSLVKQ